MNNQQRSKTHLSYFFQIGDYHALQHLLKSAKNQAACKKILLEIYTPLQIFEKAGEVGSIGFLHFIESLKIGGSDLLRHTLLSSLEQNEINFAKTLIAMKKIEPSSVFMKDKDHCALERLLSIDKDKRSKPIDFFLKYFSYDLKLSKDPNELRLLLQKYDDEFKDDRSIQALTKAWVCQTELLLPHYSETEITNSLLSMKQVSSKAPQHSVMSELEKEFNLRFDPAQSPQFAGVNSNRRQLHEYYIERRVREVERTLEGMQLEIEKVGQDYSSFFQQL